MGPETILGEAILDDESGVDASPVMPHGLAHLLPLWLTLDDITAPMSDKEDEFGISNCP
jgi:hypothetical protein